jgi:hypothetical protein
MGAFTSNHRYLTGPAEIEWSESADQFGENGGSEIETYSIEFTQKYRWQCNAIETCLDNVEDLNW